MALDFQQVRQQIKELGEKAPQREAELLSLREQARESLNKNAANQEYLREKIQRALNAGAVNLRCAIPTDEAFTNDFLLPAPPAAATIIAADGSQINPNRHFAIEYCLVNVGAIQMEYGQPDAPQPLIRSDLMYEEIDYDFMNEGMVALMRDQREREVLAEMVETAPKPVITFTDGPIELWGREEIVSQRFNLYLAALSRLHSQGAVTAGYVDKPRSDLVVRLLELAELEDNKVGDAGKHRRFKRVRDTELFEPFLKPGARTAIFGIQSKAGARYEDHLALHFFYLNVSLSEKPYLARVEIPAWVANNKNMVDDLHAILVEQCQIMLSSPYPYLLHRAHETAVVTRDEKEQVDTMISLELRNQGMFFGTRSGKQMAKDASAIKPKKK